MNSEKQTSYLTKLKCQRSTSPSIWNRWSNPSIIWWQYDDSPLPFTVSVTKVKAKHGRKPEQILTHGFLLLDMTTDIHEAAVLETLLLQGGHPTFGLITDQNPKYLDTITFTRCGPGTISHKQIRQWKSRLCGDQQYVWLTTSPLLILHNLPS
jgi:hypothetical protein